MIGYTWVKIVVHFKNVNSLSDENCKADASGDKMWWNKRPHDSLERTLKIILIWNVRKVEQRLADDKHVSSRGSEVKKEELKKNFCMCFETLLHVLFVYLQERLN